MKRISFHVIASLSVMALVASPLSSSADLLGETVSDAASANYESLAVQVKASQLMNTAEELKPAAPATKAAAELSAAAYDDKADDYKDKAAAAYSKAAEYLTLANTSTSPTEKADFVKAADNYEKTSYFYSVAADLYLAAQQKVLGAGSVLKTSATSSDKVGNASLRTLADAKVAATEAKVELAVQKNTKEAIADANSVSTTVATTQGVSDAKASLTALSANVETKKEELLSLAAGYSVKATASKGEIKKTYEAVVATYVEAAAIAATASTESVAAVSKFTNAVPEAPVNPGENLKWHQFHADPDVALAVMKYNFAQLSMSAVRWQGEAQNVANNPAPYLSSEGRSQPVSEYVDGFRTSSLTVTSEAGDLTVLIGRYNDEIPGASSENVEKWKSVSSYLADIIVTYQEIAQAQYQIYSLLTMQLGGVVKKASLVAKSTEVVAVLKAGEKKVAIGGEIQSSLVENKTQVDVYTSQPGESATITLAKAGAKTVTLKDTTDANGLAEFNLPKSYVGYTATVKLAGKTLDREAISSFNPAE